MREDAFNIERLIQTHTNGRRCSATLGAEINADKLFHAPGSVARLLPRSCRKTDSLGTVVLRFCCSIIRVPSFLCRRALPNSGDTGFSKD